MNSIILSLNVAIPLAGTIFTGYFFRQSKLLSQGTIDQMNHLVYKCFLPVLMFLNIYKTDVDMIRADSSVLLFAAVFILGEYLILLIGIPVIERDHRRSSVMIQGIYRSNFISFGSVVVSSIYGDSAVGITSMLCSVVVPLYNVLAVFTFELLCGKKVSPGSRTSLTRRNVHVSCRKFFL